MRIVVLMSAEDLESLEATIELLRDETGLARAREADFAVEAGEVTTASDMAALRPSDARGRIVSADPDSDAYESILSRFARRALSETLPSVSAFAAWEFITGPLAQRPRTVGVPLREPFEGLWRATRGECRVRYRIDDEARRLIVLDVDHRRGGYRA